MRGGFTAYCPPCHSEALRNLPGRIVRFLPLVGMTHYTIPLSFRGIEESARPYRKIPPIGRNDALHYATRFTHHIFTSHVSCYQSAIQYNQLCSSFQQKT